MSALETIQLMLAFGMFVIALIKLIVDIVNQDKKK
ncbi:putative holin-like toxin [Vagococcus hydrophili]|uniref:Putative holin-like toxin n=1 Tax=Vagococcus hydrophili TaxID=2714947 RepID=A0A6G8ATC6_9ENTE|nr:putative holin-like toxin [Vagococcus hydrophili]QIL48328.1 putative holin-like toxin [Vagococcus hydrophili]